MNDSGYEGFYGPAELTSRRVGGFFSLIWMLFKYNRHCKRVQCKARYEFDLPVKWLG